MQRTGNKVMKIGNPAMPYKHLALFITKSRQHLTFVIALHDGFHHSLSPAVTL